MRQTTGIAGIAASRGGQDARNTRRAHGWAAGGFPGAEPGRRPIPPAWRAYGRLLFHSMTGEGDTSRLFGGIIRGGGGIPFSLPYTIQEGATPSSGSDSVRRRAGCRPASRLQAGFSPRRGGRCASAEAPCPVPQQPAGRCWKAGLPNAGKAGLARAGKASARLAAPQAGPGAAAAAPIGLTAAHWKGRALERGALKRAGAPEALSARPPPALPAPR